MANVLGLRSPYDQVGGIVYFGRMVDKIRLHGRGELPDEYVINLGEKQGMFDLRCLTFLQIRYAGLMERTLAGDSDEALLAWAFARGKQPSDEEIEIWNAFMMKRGWRDAGHARLISRIEEAGFPADCGIETMFEYIDWDEGRMEKRFL